MKAFLLFAALACVYGSVVKAGDSRYECGPVNVKDCLDMKAACIPNGGEVFPDGHGGGTCLQPTCNSDIVTVSGINFSKDDPQYFLLQPYQDDINGVYTRVNGEMVDESYLYYRREVNTNGTGVFGSTVQLVMGMDQYGWSWQGSWIFQFQEGSWYFARSVAVGPDPTMVGQHFGSPYDPEIVDHRAMNVAITCEW
jgi:hypothetical protein